MENYFSLPAFEKNPIDTIGAGDAVLAISSALFTKILYLLDSNYFKSIWSNENKNKGT